MRDLGRMATDEAIGGMVSSCFSGIVVDTVWAVIVAHGADSKRDGVISFTISSSESIHILSTSPFSKSLQVHII